MHSKYLGKLPHSCGTSKGLQTFMKEDGTIDGWCFSCETYVKDPYGENPVPKPKGNKLSEEKIEELFEEINSYKTVSITWKCLHKDSLKYYGIKTSLSEEDGKTPTALYYPYYLNGELIGYKVKILKGKRFFVVGTTKGAEPFGYHLAMGSRASKLIITEGEDDTVAWHRVLERKQKEAYKGMYAIISLPSGVSSAKNFFMTYYKKLSKKFKNIYLSFDMDDVGRRTTEDILKIYPNIGVLETPSKDANQSVIDGKEDELFGELFRVGTPKNTRVIHIESIWNTAKEPPRFGELSWPWESLQKITRGIRYGETIYIGAGTKMGKSEVVNTLATHFIMKDNVKVFLAKPEEDNKKTIKLLAGKAMGKIFHDPLVEFDERAFDKAESIFKDKVTMLDLYQHVDWDNLKEDIHYNIHWGAKAIFIDPITNLTSGMPSSDANIFLERVTREMSVIAKDHGVVFFIFCHLKSPEGYISDDSKDKKYAEGKFISLGNCPHEEGGSVKSSQFAGSRSMQRACNLMIGIEGNKDEKLTEEQRAIRRVRILEDREFGNSAYIDLMWDRNTSLFREVGCSMQ